MCYFKDVVQFRGKGMSSLYHVRKVRYRDVSHSRRLNLDEAPIIDVYEFLLTYLHGVPFPYRR